MRRLWMSSRRLGRQRRCRRAARVATACLTALVAYGPPAQARAQAPPPPSVPRILIDQPLRAVEYQLNRLGNDDLARLERKPGDPRYRPVYVALLTRRGLVPALREEAVAALTGLDRSSRAQAIVHGLSRVAANDAQTAGGLLTMLFAEPASALAAERDTFAKLTAEQGTPGPALAGAYGAMLIADGNVDAVWPLADQRRSLEALLTALAHLPWQESLAPTAPAVAARVTNVIEDSNDAAVRRAAVHSLAVIRPDAATFGALAGEIVQAADAEVRTAAVRAIATIPSANWPRDQLEPLARRIVEIVRSVPQTERTQPAVLDTIELGSRLAAALPSEPGRAIRRDLRALGATIVRISAVREELRFDVRWFAVEAGRPVEIVLVNPDAMPHNLVVGRPGSLEEIGTKGSAMAMPVDPAAKPFVPDSPLVLYATALVNFGEEARLRFTAPKEPGEYPFVCTFPGHWLRMYGVMLVVSDLEAWDAKPTAPTDPITKQRFP